MTKPILKLVVLSLLVGAIAGAPTQALGQEKKKDKPVAGKKEPSMGEKKEGVIPFHGKLASVDKSAKTITVGERTFQITADTKIMKAGKPATLDDCVVGEEIGGRYKKTEDGKLVVVGVRFGPKPEGESGGKKKQEE